MGRRAGAAPVSPAPAPSSHLSPWVQAGRTAGRLGRNRGLAELVCWLLSFPRNHRTRSLDEAGSHRCLGKAKNSGTLGPIPQQHWDCRPHTGQISPLLEDSSPGLLPESYINQPEQIAQGLPSNTQPHKPQQPDHTTGQLKVDTSKSPLICSFPHYSAAGTSGYPHHRCSYLSSLLSQQV